MSSTNRDGGGNPTPPPYNILPTHDILSNHPTLRYAEVRAATNAILDVGDLRKPPYRAPPSRNARFDILDWLGCFFGFQEPNVRNQREHLVLLLANRQMRDQPGSIDVLDSVIVRDLRKKILENYISWCSFLRRPPNIWTLDGWRVDERRDLLYIALYLLVWGEAANLRFVPECLCYIFHHMAMELNWILEDKIDEGTGAPVVPVSFGENAFLHKVVTPVYKTIKKEVDSSKNGTEPHSSWRNYDDINEYFWDERCFSKVKWPMDLTSSFFWHDRNEEVAHERNFGVRKRRKFGKTGFVEQRSFWNLFRSFDRMWIMLILFLQAGIIVAWNEDKYPWQGLKKRDVRVRLFSVFITWSGLRFLQSLLDAGTQYSLVSRETKMVGVRMVLKSVAAAAWTLLFIVLYNGISNQKNGDWNFIYGGVRIWNQNVDRNFIYAVAVFVLPELLAFVLLLVPWLSNLVEKSDLRAAHFFTWWFQSRTFVGRGIRVGTVDNVKYGFYWIVVLAAKFAFSYFLQIKPMVAPTKKMLDLRNINYRWHQFFSNSNRFAVGLYWLPVVLIYLTDISIWYSILSTIVGAFASIISHLGEIRDVQQLRLRFQFFVGAMQFNLLPEDPIIPTWGGNLRKRFQDTIQRLKLRYGFGQPYKKIDSTQVEATRFTLIWNEVIQAFREEDIISNKEVELLELPANAWGITVLRWPCFLLCNELQHAVSQAKSLASTSDSKLWRKMSKREYRKCAVIEAYDSVKFLLYSIIKEDTEEHSIVSEILSLIDDSVRVGKFTEEYNMSSLESIHSNLVSLLDILVKPNKDLDKVVNKLQTIFNTVTRNFAKQRKNWSSKSGLLFEKAVELPGDEEVDFYKQVRRLHAIVSCTDSMSDVPKNLEARRRIAFFSNSLFMNMPRAPSVERMLGFSVLTPYYAEEVVYTLKQLKDKNDDGVSILYYLKTIYADEWKNCTERMRDEESLDENKTLMDLRLWASHRGQTLTRTVRGMMYYYRALKMLTFLDNASEMDKPGDASRELAPLESSTKSPSSRSLSASDNRSSRLFEGHEYGTAMMKFTYVVACQLYGSQKKEDDPRAADILNLMKHNEALRIAYADEVDGRDGKEYYSLLVKYDHELDKEVVIYRIRLPGPLILGEGKPENQNHAVIFTRGDAVQTIDMNQDNYFEESLKMRNLLEEFTSKYGRKPTILGVREYIFTASVSSLAWFMSAQETSFVTLCQRVLAEPLKVRMHYGHSDVFDRVWFLSRGGVSKASRVINISEDIFAGFNCTLRDGNVIHREYIQVGKGRDVGLNQIYLFEGKVASGNGEQVSSRDVYRLGHRLDFFRMLSFYYSTVGFYFNTMMVILTAYVFLWGQLYMALSGIEESIITASSNNFVFRSVIMQQFIIQLGIYTFLPMIVENSLENDFLAGIRDFIKMQLELAPVFYTFSMGTRAHYFGRTILHGGAKYQATGRGFVVEHTSFCENYRLYARSHFIKAIELGLILTVYASYSPVPKGSYAYIDMAITGWFLVASWLMAPFWFNPSGFDCWKTVNDFEDFINWTWYRGGIFSKPNESWEAWWNKQGSDLRTTGICGKLLKMVIDLRFFFFQYGIVYRLKISNGSSSILVYLLSWICIVVALGVFLLISHARDKYSAKYHKYYRTIQAFILVVNSLVLILLFKYTHFGFSDIFTALLAFIPTGWGLISIAQVVRTFVKSQSENVFWNTVVSVARLYEILIGVIVIAPVAILSWAPGIQALQTRMLFNDAFGRGLEMSRILGGTKAGSKSRRGSEDLKEA